MKTIIGIAMLVFLVACSAKPEYSHWNLINCEQGEYSLPPKMKELMTLSGNDITQINVIEYERTCDAYAKLAKPRMVLGTELDVIPVASCNKYAVKSAVSYVEKNYADKTEAEKVELIMRYCE